MDFFSVFLSGGVGAYCGARRKLLAFFQTVFSEDFYLSVVLFPAVFGFHSSTLISFFVDYCILPVSNIMIDKAASGAVSQRRILFPSERT